MNRLFTTFVVFVAIGSTGCGIHSKSMSPSESHSVATSRNGTAPNTPQRALQVSFNRMAHELSGLQLTMQSEYAVLDIRNELGAVHPDLHRIHDGFNRVRAELNQEFQPMGVEYALHDFFMALMTSAIQEVRNEFASLSQNVSSVPLTMGAEYDLRDIAGELRRERPDFLRTRALFIRVNQELSQENLPMAIEYAIHDFIRSLETAISICYG